MFLVPGLTNVDKDMLVENNLKKWYFLIYTPLEVERSAKKTEEVNRNLMNFIEYLEDYRSS